MKANILLPGDNGKSDVRCSMCSTFMHYGTGKMVGRLVCTSCGNIVEHVKDAPKTGLKSVDNGAPMLVQGKGKKRGDWDDLLPKGAYIVKEEDFSY